MYPASDDIFRRNLEERDIDPEDGSPKERLTRKDQDDYAELDFTEDLSGDDLDVPGSELDDAQEEIGSEDEENNYYSLGGERHDDWAIKKCGNHAITMSNLVTPDRTK